MLRNGKYSLILVHRLVFHPKALFAYDGCTFFLDSDITTRDLEQFASSFERRVYEITTLYALSKQKAVQAVENGYLVFASRNGYLSTFPGQGAIVCVSCVPVACYVEKIRSGTDYAVTFEEEVAVLRDADLVRTLIELIEEDKAFLARPL